MILLLLLTWKLRFKTAHQCLHRYTRTPHLSWTSLDCRWSHSHGKVKWLNGVSFGDDTASSRDVKKKSYGAVSATTKLWRNMEVINTNHHDFTSCVELVCESVMTCWSGPPEGLTGVWLLLPPISDDQLDVLLPVQLLLRTHHDAAAETRALMGATPPPSLIRAAKHSIGLLYVNPDNAKHI